MSETRVRDRGTEDGQRRIGTVVGPRTSRTREVKSGKYQRVGGEHLASTKLRISGYFRRTAGVIPNGKYHAQKWIQIVYGYKLGQRSNVALSHEG